MLNCDRALLNPGPLQDLLLAALTCLTAQMQVALGVTRGVTGGYGAPTAAAAAAGSGSSSSGSSNGPLGSALVEELLPGSFLRHGFGALLEVVREEQQQLPTQLVGQVRKGVKGRADGEGGGCKGFKKRL